MSESEASTNNPLPLPTSPVQGQPEYQRHSKYYYEDGNVVFLANEFLFKVYAPRLAADPGATDYEFKELIEGVLDHSDTSSHKLGSDDMHPIILPNVTATQLSSFLFAVLGRIGDHDYMSFIRAAEDPSAHTPLLIGRLADTGTLAVRFGMNNLDSWLNSQLLLIPRRSPLLVITWDQQQPVLRSVITYLQMTRVITTRNELFAWVELAVCHYSDSSRTQAPANLDVLVSWYRDQPLLANSPRTFGCLFAAILAQGHLSTIWNEVLTREERRIFFAAHAVLTRICDHTDLEVEWLTQPTGIKDICSESACALSFDNCWGTGFNRCKKLESSVPLEDIRRILRLPTYRYWFADRSKDWSCPSQCAQKTLAKIDAGIGQVFLALAAKHEFFARTT